MIDVERELSDALHAYAVSVTPSAPPTDVINGFTTTVSRDLVSPRHRDRRVLVAAALLIVVSGVVLWSVRRDDATKVISPAMTVVPPLGAGSWKTVPEGPLSPRKFATVLWTGHEFIVWGGQQDNVSLADGAAYDPATATWRKLRANPRAEAGANAVWTGTRMVVLARGGGESYDPVSDTWSSMPSIDVSASGGVGFTNVVWTGSQLLGLGVEDLNDSNKTRVLRVWTLLEGKTRWSPPATVSITSGGPVMRSFAYYPNQFTVWDTVPTDDGLVVWDGRSDGWRYSTTNGWTKLPTLTLPTGTHFTTDGSITWQSGRLVDLINVQQDDGTNDSFDLAMLDGAAWSPLRRISKGWAASSRLISVGDGVVVLGAFVGDGPLLIDPTTQSATAMAGYPIEPRFSQGAAWSGTQLFVWGGQTVSVSGSGVTGAADGTDQQPTDHPAGISNQGAIWQP